VCSILPEEVICSSSYQYHIIDILDIVLPCIVAICNGFVEQMLSHANISLNGISLSIIFFFPTTQDWELFKIDKLPLHVLVLTFLITTLQTSFFLFFCFLARMDVSTSYNSSSAINPCYLKFATRVRAQIIRGAGFVLYKINRVVIAISSTLLNKSIGTNSRTQTFFSCKLH